MQTKRKGEWCEFNVPHHWDHLTIQEILKEKWQVPKGLLHQLRMDKGVRLNGNWVPWDQTLATGDRLQIQFFKEENFGLIPNYLPVDPLYEDDHLLIVNKPSGIATHPTSNTDQGTLANAIAAYFETNGTLTKVRHIHRLDYDTSGGIVFAKHALSGALLDRMLAERKIKRTYYAYVHGIISPKKGIIDEPIGRDRHHPTRRRVSPKGEIAITEYVVRETYPKMNVSVVELTLHTGRTHQIRVHLSHLGHPLLGDSLYGGSTKLITRQALHAVHIHLPHPLLEEPIDVDVPMPTDLIELVDRLNKGR
ncbi:MAG TPA: RluA family pseudouridine synthase [Bacillota bacterium]|nr:RluA family pseudouridine synthase [Bacillota bacterium]